MRTAFLGTSEFAAGILRRLAASPHRPALVVTPPRPPGRRGRRLTAPPVAVTARELGLEVDQPESVNGEAARARIAGVEPDALVLCAFGALVRDPLLSDYEILNVHPSLLPRWRGAAPIERAIMAGDAETGVSIMRLGPGLDDGPVALQASVAIESGDDYATLSARLVDVGADLLLRALDERPPCSTSRTRPAPPTRRGSRPPTAPSTRRRRPSSRSASCGPCTRGARLQQPDGSFLGVRRARVGDDGRLEPLEVQPPGGRPMSYADFRRGHRRDGPRGGQAAAAAARRGGPRPVRRGARRGLQVLGRRPGHGRRPRAEEAALAVLGAERPGDGVLGEEGGAGGGAGDRRWVVDALDGTDACSATGPSSRPGPRRMIETPVSASPAMIARSIGAAPRQRGRSDEWTLRIS